jgi:hypothetical protein
VGRIYENVKGRPRFVADALLGFLPNQARRQGAKAHRRKGA